MLIFRALGASGGLLAAGSVIIDPVSGATTAEHAELILRALDVHLFNEYHQLRAAAVSLPAALLVFGVALCSIGIAGWLGEH